MGKVTVDKLLELIEEKEGGPAEDVILQHMLVSRDSCMDVKRGE
jgi:DNA-binding LacI/PurR family transcriptional regulator